MRGGDERRAPFREGVLYADEEEVPGFFAPVSFDDWLRITFALCWQQHGGSGLLITWGEALELELSERNALLDLVGERRRLESEAIKKAHEKKS